MHISCNYYFLFFHEWDNFLLIWYLFFLMSTLRLVVLSLKFLNSPVNSQLCTTKTNLDLRITLIILPCLKYFMLFLPMFWQYRFPRSWEKRARKNSCKDHRGRTFISESSFILPVLPHPFCHEVMKSHLLNTSLPQKPHCCQNFPLNHTNLRVDISSPPPSALLIFFLLP